MMSLHKKIELMHEVKRLQEEVTKLKGKEQVRPSQDNRDSVVKKLEKGSNITAQLLNKIKRASSTRIQKRSL